MTPPAPLASAIKDLACAQKTTFATTQAGWRFFNNERISFSQLNEPIISLALQQVALSPHPYAPVVHDWSHLQFRTHNGKEERLKMTHGGDVGYEPQTRLLVDAANGLPIAPLSQTLTGRAGCRSTLTEGLSESLTHMDALTADIARVEFLDTGKKLVHLIDREGNSIGHMRTLSSQGICWLIRGKEGHRAEWGGDTRKIGEIADDLPFIANGQVGWKGKKANMEIGETSVIITRTAKPKRKDKNTGRRVKVQPGVALTLRLVVVRLTDTHGKFIGRWTLLTNVSNELTSAEVARWYYWRWGIESFFKLLKGAGHDVEKWLQRSAGALLRRLLIASMACVLVWRLQRAEGDDNAAARQLICRLSGQQQKRGRKESAPALLAGLSILLNTLTLLADYTPEELAHFAMVVFNPL
ncbi:transposase [Symbiopectobacterium sp. RP]